MRAIKKLILSPSSIGMNRNNRLQIIDRGLFMPIIVSFVATLRFLVTIFFRFKL